MPGCPILTYHSQLLFGNDYGNNSHVGLAEDLAVIAASGRHVVDLGVPLAAQREGRRDLDLDRLVCITFDDGPDFDWLDIDHPEHGPQRSFGTLLRAHAQAHPQALAVTGTSFVIGDPAARQAISRAAMDADWMNDHWWREAEASGVLRIESHGLDHRHPCLKPGDPDFGHYGAIADEASCVDQVDRASALIAERSGRRPQIFCYPSGQASDYLRHEYLPRFEARHGLHAAVSTAAGHFHWDSDRWFLPRYVSLQHWHSPDDLRHLLNG